MGHKKKCQERNLFSFKTVRLLKISIQISLSKECHKMGREEKTISVFQNIVSHVSD
jgi:hypothetical protein